MLAVVHFHVLEGLVVVKVLLLLAWLEFVVTYNTTRLNLYTDTKDHIDKLAHYYIVYKFCCPGCSNNYIGKMERTLVERKNEHAFKDKNSVVYNHINNCDGVK